MNNQLQDFIVNIDQADFNSFLKRSKSDFLLSTNVEEVKIDYSWVSFVESILPHIDNIVRNPRRFLIQEEDLNIVEKTKKVTQETIKHLATHSSLIQDVDDNGDVKPKKLLNVYKEETFDIYENRFFYTLMKRLMLFLDLQLTFQDKDSHISKKRVVNFGGETYQVKENVKINISLETNSYRSLDIDSESYKARIRNINVTLNEFTETAFLRSLKMASPVKNPIRRTNLILKNPDFRKCLELWEFLDKYESEKIIKINNYTNKDKSLEIKLRYLFAYFFEYKAIDYKANIIDEKKSLFEVYLDKSIDECINNFDWKDEEYIDLVNKKLKETKIRREQIKTDIFYNYKKFIKNNNDNFENALSVLNY